MKSDEIFADRIVKALENSMKPIMGTNLYPTAYGRMNKEGIKDLIIKIMRGEIR